VRPALLEHSVLMQFNTTRNMPYSYTMWWCLG